MAAPPVPSVLEHRPLLAPSSAWRPLAAPSAPAPADDGQIRCSQCKKRKPPSEYPRRLINLQPYQVCTAHGWYWTQAKQLSQWAPSTRSSLPEVCEEASRVRDTQGKWLVEGGAGDRQVFVERIAAAGNWTAEEQCVISTVVSPGVLIVRAHSQIRPSTAKGDAAPSPTWVYTLWPSSTSTAPASEPQHRVKLQLWHHAAAGAFTITLKADGVAKQPSPWARPGRVRPSQAKKSAEGVQAPLDGELAPSAPVVAAPGDIVVAPPPAPPQKRRARFAPSAPSAARDREQMPPPPVPAARPAKKARRVEPQLVSPVPTSSAFASSTTPFSASAGSEWSHFLSFPTLVASQPAAHQQPHHLQHPAQHDFPLDPLLLSAFPSTAPATAPALTPAPDPPPLSLAELLSSAIFEPPIIDLPPRVGAHAPSRAGRDLDAAVADALGATPDALSDGEDDDEEEQEGDEGDARERYYEDSIPDESSAEEDDDDRDGGGSVSSFFESSAEETEYGTEDEGAGTGDGESDDGEDNWLEGFAAQQMGLRRGSEEEDEVDDEEDDELSDGAADARAEVRRVRSAGARKGDADDEVDQLESPTSGDEAK
ncbi:hypothetical protein JCM3770_004738 [Rhodotorula araucariae]